MDSDGVCRCWDGDQYSNVVITIAIAIVIRSISNSSSRSIIAIAIASSSRICTKNGGGEVVRSSDGSGIDPGASSSGSGSAALRIEPTTSASPYPPAQA
jgi:uncharacterized membrane protein YgcG